MTDIAGLCNALASDCDEGDNNNWENDDWKAASETLRQAADKISDLQSKLDFAAVALKPFADCMKYIGDIYEDDECPDSWSPFIEVRHYKNAEAAIKGAKA